MRYWMVKPVKEDFPHGDSFTVKIVHKDGKDGKDTKTCWFQGESYVQKYITNNNLKKKDYTIQYKNEEFL